MRKLLSAIAFLAISIFWACHLNEGENEDRFDLIGDSSWVECDEVTVLLVDKDGNELDQLFKGPLTSVDELKNLSAKKYDGTSATIRITGTKDGGVCIDEKRSFEGDGTNLKVDTIKSLIALPTAVVVEPDSISIPLGGAGVAVIATIKPAYADQSVEWRIAGDGIVSYTALTGGSGNQVKINPSKLGSTEVLVISGKDSSKTGRLKVTVTAPTGTKVEIDPDSVIVYIGGSTETLVATVLPEGASQKVVWSSLEPSVASIDSLGRVKGLKEGETYVQARSVANNGYQSSHVKVRLDAPKLTIASKTGAPVNTPITFSPHSSQQYGAITVFKWDLDGDGAYEDSTADTWPGKEVDLPPLTAKYSKEGQVTAKFLVRDGEGNESVAQVVLDIGNQAPEFTSLAKDTSVSINDSVPLPASVRDVDGKVSWVGWDYENDGVFDDSLAPDTDSVRTAFGRKYADAGVYRAIIKAKDETGKSRLDTVLVRVELDRPRASAGNDTTVTVGALVPVHVGSADKYGTIEKREVRLHGSGTGFQVLSKEDTVFTAPNDPGAYMVVVRVTDDDGLMDVDTMVVTVVLSANADLSNLVFSAGALNPAFKTAISLFTANVGYADESVTITPTAKDPEAKITVNAKPVNSGSPSEPVKLLVGSNPNVFQIIVTAPDGTQRYFSVSVARDPSADASLSKLDVTGFTLKPAFATTILDYADTVPSSTAFVTFKPTVVIPTATITLNDAPLVSGTATSPLPLEIGENVFKVVVTSQSGSIKTTYTAKVIRRAQFVLLRSLDGKPGTQLDSSESVPGAPRPLSGDPVTGWHFVKWTLLEGTAVIKDSLANPTEITLNSGKVKAQANYVINQYVIKASGNAGGSIAPSGDVSVNHGVDQAFSIQALPGFRLRALNVDGSNGLGGIVNGVYTFKAVSVGHTISADFVQVDTLSATSGIGGSVTPAKIVVDRGTDTAFTVSGQPDFKISVFTDNGADKKAEIDVNGRYPVKADGSHAIAATWIQGLLMKGVAGTGGGITPDSVVVDAGSTVVYSITLNSFYRIDKLLDNGADSTHRIASNKYTLFNVDKKHTVTVTFWKQYTLTVNAKGPGTVTGIAGIVDSNESRSFTLNYGADVKVKSLLVDGAPSNLTTIPFTFIKANHTIDVEFVRMYNFTTTWSAGGIAGAGGSISPPNPTLDSNASVEFTIAPALNYRTDTLRVDGSLVAATTTKVPFANIASGHSVAAVFKRTFSLTAGVGGGKGTISPSGKTVVDTNDNQLFKFVPDAGYRFDQFLDDGKPLLATPGSTEHTLPTVKADHNYLSVVFKRQYSVTDSMDGLGTVMHEALADSGTSPGVLVEPAKGYRLTSLTDNGANVDFDPIAGVTFKISDITADHKIVAIFTRYYSISATVNDPVMGSVSPTSVQVAANSNLNITITANPGYQVVSITDGVTTYPPTTLYQLTSISANHSIVANFAPIVYHGVIMGDSVEGLGSRQKASTSNLCFIIGKGGDPVCKNPVSFEVTDGTLLTLSTDDYVCVSSDIGGCLEKISFVGWVASSSGKPGTYKPLEPTNPAQPWVGQRIAVGGTLFIRPMFSSLR